MKTASISELKQELLTQPPKKVMELCLRLAKYKKENKELLAFLLFDADNEPGYVESIKLEIDDHFSSLPHSTWYHTKKSLRKILRLISKYSKHVTAKESEVEMLLYFLISMKRLHQIYPNNQAFYNLYLQQLKKINTLIEQVHEDIRYDYKKQVEEL
jgi:hypothetical protein